MQTLTKQVALYARVSTTQQQQQNTIASQVQAIKAYIQKQTDWHLLPEHEFIDEGISGTRLDRPALDRLRDCGQRGEIDLVVALSPDRLARNYAHQWLLIEEFDKLHIPWVFLQNPFGDTPQGKLLTQMQGMIAEYERTQIIERTRRGRLEKARQGEFIPWAYRCYGYRYVPKRYGSAPQVMIDIEQAEMVRRIFRWLVKEQLSCRQITKRLNEAKIAPPANHHPVWYPASVRNILTNRTYMGQARYNYRQPVLPRYRKGENADSDSRKTGRSYRPESEWVWSTAPMIISPEVFEQAQQQLKRNAERARKLYQPSSRRYLLRCLVKCGECGLGMTSIRLQSKCKKYEYLYYDCKGGSPLTCGRPSKCLSHLVRADRLDAVVWQAVQELLQRPEVIPQLHHQWASTQQQDQAALQAQRTQLAQRRSRLEKQIQRLVDAYQAELINLEELRIRRQKLTQDMKLIEQECQQLNQAEHETTHWKHIVDNAKAFSHLLGENLSQLTFEERQAVVQCLIEKVVVTGEQVDIVYALPFASAPQVCHNKPMEPSEGTIERFLGLRLAHLLFPSPEI